MIRNLLKKIFLLFLFVATGLPLFSQDSVKLDSVAPQHKPKPRSEFLYQDSDYIDAEEFHHFSLRTPYHALASHLNFLKVENWHPDSAAMVLNMRNPRSKNAQLLALKLKEILEARGYFADPETMPRDADFIDSASGRNLLRPFPKLKDVYLVKVGNRWVYSQFTVQSIERMHKDIFPLGTVDWAPQWSRENFAGLQLWQWIGLLIYAITAWIIHKVFMLIGSVLLRGIARWISKENIAYTFFRDAARPFSLLVISALAIWLLPMLTLPALLNKYMMIVLQIFIPVFGIMMAYYMVDVLMAFLLKRAEKTPSDLDNNLMPMLRKILKGAVIVIGFLVILSNLDVNITAVLAGLSIGGIAVALAAQDTVKNLFGSLMIYLDHPFKVGDWIISGDIEGTVEEIGMRSTRIRTFADSLIYIPNGKLADSAINNMGLRVFRRLITNISIDYETPNELIEVFTQGMNDIVMSHPYTRKEETFINLHELGPYSMNIRVIMYFSVKDTLTESIYRQEMLMAFLRLADRVGVRIAVPRQILHVEKLPGEDPIVTKQYPSAEEARKKASAFVGEVKERFKE